MRKQSPFFALVLCLPEKSKSKTGCRQKFWREKGCRQKFWREEGRRQKKWEHHLISGKTGNFWERHGENPDAWSFGARFFATEATQWNWKKCAQILWESEFDRSQGCIFCKCATSSHDRWKTTKFPLWAPRVQPKHGASDHAKQSSKLNMWQ